MNSPLAFPLRSSGLDVGSAPQRPARVHLDDSMKAPSSFLISLHFTSFLVLAWFLLWISLACSFPFILITLWSALRSPRAGFLSRFNGNLANLTLPRSAFPSVTIDTYSQHVEIVKGFSVECLESTPFDHRRMARFLAPSCSLGKNGQLGLGNSGGEVMGKSPISVPLISRCLSYLQAASSRYQPLLPTNRTSEIPLSPCARTKSCRDT